MDLSDLYSVSVDQPTADASMAAIVARLQADDASEASGEPALVAPASGTPLTVRVSQAFVSAPGWDHGLTSHAITWIASTVENASGDVSAIFSTTTPAILVHVTATAAATLPVGAALGAGAWETLTELVFTEAGTKRALVAAVTGDRSTLALGDELALDAPPANITATTVVSAIRLLTSATGYTSGSQVRYHASENNVTPHTKLRRGTTTKPLLIVCNRFRAGPKLAPIAGFRVHVDIVEPYDTQAEILDAEVWS